MSGPRAAAGTAGTALGASYRLSGASPWGALVSSHRRKIRLSDTAAGQGVSVCSPCPCGNPPCSPLSAAGSGSSAGRISGTGTPAAQSNTDTVPSAHIQGTGRRSACRHSRCACGTVLSYILSAAISRKSPLPGICPGVSHRRIANPRYGSMPIQNCQCVAFALPVHGTCSNPRRYSRSTRVFPPFCA